jgi:DMSO/TMAO reductase YedYZ heme-binding membrane subunit
MYCKVILTFPDGFVKLSQGLLLPDWPSYARITASPMGGGLHTMDAQRARHIRLLFYVAVALYSLIVVYVLARTPAPLAYNLARAAALFGYGTLFVTILSHEYMREMRKLFGKPFMTVHHILAVTGLVLVILHPVLMAIMMGDPRQFVPRFDSLRTFLTLGGRAALYLILIAALAAVVRRRLKDTWKVVHWLNYAAFVLIFAHSWLLGGNVSTSILKFVSPLMLLTVVVVFLRKRLARKT